jgi:Flp pilus assembly protein TadG
MPTLWTKLTVALRAFDRSRAGNVAITFAIATLPVIGAVGAAVDYSRANAVKAAMQAALDSTALMLARDAATLTDTQLQTKASSYFLAMFNRPEANTIAISASYSASGGSQVTVNGQANVPTSIMNAVGYDHITVKGTATSKWGSERLRVALALDNTGSMNDDGKMSALKSATKNLLTQLKAAASTNGDVYVSIIPFARTVNVGTVNKNAAWLDWTDWNTMNGSCRNYSGRGTPSDKSSCQNASGNWTSSDKSNWNGCVGDRGDTSAPNSANYDQNSTAPGTTTASKFPAWQDDPYCPVKMLGLTYDWTQLNNLVDTMQPAGGTNQPIGLVWGWHSLVGIGPLSAPAKDVNYKYSEYIILMSDGLNTIDRWYGNGSSVSSAVDKRMYDSTKNGSGTCANIKAAGIKIYAIQVDTGGDGESQIMKNCASSSDMFYRITKSGDLVSVFTAIGTNLTKLRVAK